MWLTLPSVVTVNALILPHYVHILRTTLTPETRRSQPTWPSMDNGAVGRNVRQVETAITLMQFVQDADTGHV